MSEESSRRIIGAAQSPSQVYKVVRRHPVGHRVARAIAARHGVVVGSDVRILREAEHVRLAGTNAHATYISLKAGLQDIYRWEEVFPQGRIFITLHRSVFLSDESIVAHLTHELSEVEGLRRAFDEADGWMSAPDLEALISPGKVGNLHDQAWDAADRAVELMRTDKSP